MKKNKQDLINRRMFVQMCFEQPEHGAKYLNKIARKMKNEKKSIKIVELLSDVLFISECTIYRDLEGL